MHTLQHIALAPVVIYIALDLCLILETVKKQHYHSLVMENMIVTAKA